MRSEYDDEANNFHGEVINIRDVITFQGKSVDELRKAFEDSVEDYLAFCAEEGKNQSNHFQDDSQYAYHRSNTVKSS